MVVVCHGVMYRAANISASANGSTLLTEVLTNKRRWNTAEGLTSSQFMLNVGCRNTMRAITWASLARIRLTIALTCSSSSRSLSLLRSLYTGRLFRLLRIKAIL